MCNANYAMGAQAFGGVYGAYSSVRQGQMQDDYYSYVADSTDRQAELSSVISDKQRSIAMDQAASEAKRFKDASSKAEGTQRAQMAANGVLGSVTSQDIANDSYQAQKQDMDTMHYNASLKDWEMKQQAEMERYNLKSQAAQSRIAGKNAKAAGYMNAAGSLLSSASSVADTYSRWKTTSQGASQETNYLDNIEKPKLSNTAAYNYRRASNGGLA